MQVLINRHPYELSENASVSEAISAIDAQPPFAVAVNTQFVPKSQYTAKLLAAGDRIDIIFPVTGG